MKKIRVVILVLVLLVLSSCSNNSNNPNNLPNDEIKFTDEVLESKIRSAMNKPTGAITVAEAQAVTQLDLSIEPAKPLPRIRDLTTLKYFTNLTSLSLAWSLDSQNTPIDLSPLKDLTNLEALYLNSNGLIDISILANLTKMKDLKLWGNKIKDISILSQMPLMEDLWLQGNQITDITALSNMDQHLYRLYLDNNQITDISPLTKLKVLTALKLAGNPIKDYTPIQALYPGLIEKDFTLQ